MAIFNSYVKLPEGNCWASSKVLKKGASISVGKVDRSVGSARWCLPSAIHVIRSRPMRRRHRMMRDSENQQNDVDVDVAGRVSSEVQYSEEQKDHQITWNINERSSLVLVDGDFPRIREPMIREARFKCSQIYPAAHQRTRHFCDPAYPCAKPSDTFRRRTTFCERRVSTRRTPNMEKMKKHQWRNDIIIWRYTFRHVFTLVTSN